MKRSLALTTLVLLAACVSSSASIRTPTLKDRLRNPLFAERYWSEMAEHMADYVRTGDPIAKDPVKGAIIDAERVRALARVQEARKLRDDGVSGPFKTGKEEVHGEALLLGNSLFIGSNFLAYPDPSAHVFLSAAVDPRDVNFPDTSSIDLGPLESPYGELEYVIPEGRMNPEFRTVVLYDTRLSIVLAFAQLSK